MGEGSPSRAAEREARGRDAPPARRRLVPPGRRLRARGAARPGSARPGGAGGGAGGRGRAGGAGLLSFFKRTLETLTQSFSMAPSRDLLEWKEARPRQRWLERKKKKKKMPVSLSTRDLEAKVVVVLSSS